MATTISARQRKLVQDGAKGVAERWVGNPEDGARDKVKFRSAVKRYSGKEQEAEQPESEAAPRQRARKRSIRAEQAATGMLATPPNTFDETAIKEWLGKMSQEDLQKLSRLTEVAKQGEGRRRKAWDKVDRTLDEQGARIDVRAGNVTINAGSPAAPARRPYRTGEKKDYNKDDWGRRLARIKDFING